MPRTGSIEITPEIPSLIAGIDGFKGSWRALGTLAPERLSALRRVAMIESVGSSTRIEGSRLGDREVERLLSNVAVGVDGRPGARARVCRRWTRPGIHGETCGFHPASGG